MEPFATTQPIPKHHTTPLVIMIVGIVVVAAAGLFVYRYMHRTPTPAQEMQLLEQTSQPITATNAERKAELDTMHAQSAPITVTPEQRQQALQRLRQ